MDRRTQVYTLVLSTNEDKPLPMPLEVQAFLEAGIQGVIAFEDVEVDKVELGKSFDAPDTDVDWFH